MQEFQEVLEILPVDVAIEVRAILNDLSEGFYPSEEDTTHFGSILDEFEIDPIEFNFPELTELAEVS